MKTLRSETLAYQLQELLAPIFILPNLLVKRYVNHLNSKEMSEIDARIENEILCALDNKTKIVNLSEKIEPGLHGLISDSYEFVDGLNSFDKENEQNVLYSANRQKDDVEPTLNLIIKWMIKAQQIECIPKNLKLTS